MAYHTMTSGMTPAKYLDGVKTVYGHRFYLTGWLRDDGATVTVTDIYNGNERTIDKRDVHRITDAR